MKHNVQNMNEIIQEILTRTGIHFTGGAWGKRNHVWEARKVESREQTLCLYAMGQKKRGNEALWVESSYCSSHMECAAEDVSP